MYFFCTSSKFETFIMTCILLNTAVTGMKVRLMMIVFPPGGVDNSVVDVPTTFGCL